MPLGKSVSNINSTELPENGIFPFTSHNCKHSSLGNITRSKGEQRSFEEAI